jgi:hypothetical protein
MASSARVSPNPPVRVGGGVAVTLAIALASVRKIYDPDLYWHLATGRFIVAHHAVPRADPFSYTSGGHWEYSDALASLWFFAAHASAGIPGVHVATALLVGATAGVVLLLVRDGARVNDASAARVDAASAIVLALWGAAVRFRFGPNADWFSFLGFAVVALAISRAEDRRSARWLFLLLPLFVLWCNCHRGGTLGVAALGLATCSFAASGAARGLAASAALATVLAALALTLNPVGPHYLTAAFDVSTRAAFRAEFPEWAPMAASFLGRVAPAFSVLVVLGMTFAIMDRGRIFRARTTLAASTTALAFYGVRFAPFAAIALAPLAAEWVAAVAGRIARTPLGNAREPLGQVLAAVVAVAIVGADYARAIPPPEAGPGVLWWKLPIGASGFLALHPPPGHMWNSFNFGGYLLDALAPSQKVFIDGRNDTVYSLPFFEETMQAGRNPGVFAHQVTEFDITYVVGECKELECRSLPWLLNDPAWALVYWDDRAFVLVKRDSRTSEYIGRFEYRTLHPDDAVRRVLHLASDPDADALEADVLRYVAEVPTSLRAEYLAALVHLWRGRTNEYVACRQRFDALAAERGVLLQPP